MAILRLAGAVAVLSMSLAAGPQFLDGGALSIQLDSLAEKPVSVVLVNPGPAVDATVRITGPAASAVSVSGTGAVRLAAGGSASVTLVAGKNLRETSGELVLFAESGIVRRPLKVVPASFFVRFWPLLAGVLLLAIAAAVGLWRWFRPRGRPGASGAGEEPGQAGFTHSDEPVEVDSLGRAEYAQELALLASSATPPMVIGVFGEWGTGKTSLLKQVRKVIDERYDDCAHVWFDPWPHQYDDNPVLPLLHTIVADLGLAGKKQISRTLRTISEVLGSVVLSSTVKVNLADVRNSLAAYDDRHFRIRSERTRLDEHLGELIAQALAETGKSRLVVFVDDLDRCAGDQITALLEALKLHFNRDNCVFFLAVAKEPLIAAVRGKYEGFPVDNYLDKIVQFPFEMPRLSVDAFHDYLDSLLREEIAPTGDLLRIGLPRNPRAVKRFLNVLILQDRVARARNLASYDVSTLAAVLLIREGDSEFYAQLTHDATLLRRIAEDLGTTEAEEVPDWNRLPLELVGQFLATGREVPDDVGRYIDLVKASPAPQHVESVEPEVPSEAALLSSDRGELEPILSVLAERVGRQVRQLVPDQGVLLAPIAQFAGESATVTLEEIVARWQEGLLVVGPPGSGKTVLAARLAIRLLDSLGPDSPVPVFLRFRFLNTSRTGFDLWMTHALVDEFRVPLHEAFAMVSRQRLVYVLDGLDEIGDQAVRSKIVHELLSWQGLTGAKVIVTDRVGRSRDPLAQDPAFVVVEVKGVAEVEALQRLARLPGVDLDRLGLTPDLYGSPEFLATLTATTSWVEDLPPGPVDFIAWYSQRAIRLLAEGFADEQAVRRTLRGLARYLQYGRRENFDSEDPEVRGIFRDGGKVGREVPSALASMIEAGLIREVAPNLYRFVHQALVEHLSLPRA